MPEMTYREWLIGMIASSYHPSPYQQENVKLIIEFADALIEEMSKYATIEP
jgi:hypothetical protein